jgi:hypothetical protein
MTPKPIVSAGPLAPPSDVRNFAGAESKVSAERESKYFPILSGLSISRGQTPKSGEFVAPTPTNHAG